MTRRIPTNIYDDRIQAMLDASMIISEAITQAQKCKCIRYATCNEAQRQLRRIQQYFTGQYRDLLELAGCENVSETVRMLDRLGKEMEVQK